MEEGGIVMSGEQLGCGVIEGSSLIQCVHQQGDGDVLGCAGEGRGERVISRKGYDKMVMSRSSSSRVM